VAGQQGQPTRFCGSVRQVMALHTMADSHPLTRPPTGTPPTTLNVWMWAPPS
jgi:hypothetical protein